MSPAFFVMFWTVLIYTYLLPVLTGHDRPVILPRASSRGTYKTPLSSFRLVPLAAFIRFTSSRAWHPPLAPCNLNYEDKFQSNLSPPQVQSALAPNRHKSVNLRAQLTSQFFFRARLREEVVIIHSRGYLQKEIRRE